MSEALTKRYDFVFLFDVQDGNPNGDPDAGNLPRIDAESGHGLVTDVCLKRKVRNFVQISRPNSESYEIFVRSSEISGTETVLNKEIRTNFESMGIDLHSTNDLDGKPRKSKGTAQGSEVNKGRAGMCKKFYDIRTFGAVMSTGPNAGQVRGPIQMTFARSIEPVITLEHSLTVSAARMEEKDYLSQIGIQGRKYTVPYGLYRCHGFISAHLAHQTGFNTDDLNLFWDALKGMFDHDHSAARGLMSARGLYVFEHETALGTAPAHQLFDLIEVERAGDKKDAARNFKDYSVKVSSNTPSGIKLIRMIG